MKILFEFEDRKYELILIHTSGSRLYGNSTPTSDWDYRGIVIAEDLNDMGLESVEGMIGGETGPNGVGERLYKTLVEAGVKGLNETDDIQLYELRNFMNMALKSNPNIMDTIFYDYKSEATIFINDYGKLILDNKHIFLNQNFKNTFSGYALAQIRKIKSHYKWIVEFPYTEEVLDILRSNFSTKFIDYNFIVENFGGKVAAFVTLQTAQDNYTHNSNPTWDEFVKTLEIDFDIEKYIIPRLINYCKPIDIKSKLLNLNEYNVDRAPNESYNIKDMMLNTGSFRPLGNSMYSLFTKGKGIFGKEGNIKQNPPREVGEFVCLVKVNPNLYKEDLDHVNNMWNWKIKRNKSRAILENEHGYDTKHASHLIRLLKNAELTMTQKMYTPEMSGDLLELVTDVRNGKYTYEWITDYAEKLNSNLELLTTNSGLPEKIKFKDVNDLTVKILKGNI